MNNHIALPSPRRSRTAFGLLLALHVLSACDAPVEAATRRPDDRAGEVTTLRWLDDLQSSFGFKSGEFSLVPNGNALANRGSDLSFHRWVEDALVVGIEGQSKGVIKDVGDLRTKGTHNSILPFLERRGSTIVDTSAEGSNLPADGMPITDTAEKCAAAPVVLGHVYVLRIDDANDSRFVALRVIEYVPDQSVTFRWRRL